MQSNDTGASHEERSESQGSAVTVGRVADVAPGSCVTVELSDGSELALYNVNGDFHATDNFCPHKGAPLAEGKLCGHVIECDWHGWQFDVRSGQCLTTSEQLQVFPVEIEDGWIRIRVADRG